LSYPAMIGRAGRALADPDIF